MLVKAKIFEEQTMRKDDKFKGKKMKRTTFEGEIPIDRSPAKSINHARTKTKMPNPLKVKEQRTKRFYIEGLIDLDQTETLSNLSRKMSPAYQASRME